MARILVAEDDRDIRELVKFTLELLSDHTVIEAVDGEEAITAATTQMPDLILLDLRMPKLGGLEACRRLKANREVADIPVVILSARGLDDEVQAGLDAGATAYLIKPLDTAQLVADVDHFLARA
ncbi:MAG: response regulator [Anaerolineae bacterium]|nr:MAG: putative two-component response regulator receiver protein [Chloroflexi bacterium OLB13]MBW7879916.1 response regulator [Anaerolineae bacterium]